MQQSHLPNLLHWDFVCIHWVMIMFYYKTCCPSSTMKALKKWLHIIIGLWMKDQNNSDGDCYLQQNQIIHVYIYNLSQKHQAQFFQWLCWGLKLRHSQQLCIASYVASSGYFISQDLNDDWIFIAASCFLNYYQIASFFYVNNKSKYYSSGVNLDCGNKVESSDTTSPASMIHREEHLARLKFQQYLQYGKTTLHI